MKQLINLSARSISGWVFGIALAAITSAAGAAVLYEQPPVDHGIGYFANSNTPQQIADDFTLGGSVSLQSITWWGGYDGNIDAGDDDFLVRLYSGISGTGTLLQEYTSAPFIRTTTSLLDGAGNSVYQYDFDLAAPLSLSGGSYYLFVENLGSSDWFWLTGSAGNAQLWGRGDDSNTWTGYSGNLAFRLNGTPTRAVPEPGSLALLLVAGAGFGLARRRGHRQ
jgi:hypothetical protein